MDLDISKLSEDDLMDLNRRIIERLQLLRSAKSLTQLARFSVGMAVKFDTDDGRTITGTVARLNQRTVTVVTASGRWRVTPSLLRTAVAPQARVRHRPELSRCRAARCSQDVSVNIVAVGDGFWPRVFDWRHSPQFRIR